MQTAKPKMLQTLQLGYLAACCPCLTIRSQRSLKNPLSEAQCLNKFCFVVGKQQALNCRNQLGYFDAPPRSRENV